MRDGTGGEHVLILWNDTLGRGGNGRCVRVCVCVCVCVEREIEGEREE